jgi:hypothetical protein
MDASRFLPALSEATITPGADFVRDLAAYPLQCQAAPVVCARRAGGADEDVVRGGVVGRPISVTGELLGRLAIPGKDDSYGKARRKNRGLFPNPAAKPR